MAPEVGPLLSCRELTKFYAVGEGVFALRSVNLDVFPGDFVLITGPSGSGKTTLLNLLAGIDRPTHGEVLLRGRKYSRLSEDDLVMLRRKEVGVVFQFFNLLPDLNVWENVAFPLQIGGRYDDDAVKRVAYLLKAVGLEDRSVHFPHELSGGEQQRVAIARALVTRPSLILADEPTGNLDSANSRAIMELFARFNSEERQTFVVVSHESEFACYANRVIRLLDGQIKEEKVGARRG